MTGAGAVARRTVEVRKPRDIGDAIRVISPWALMTWGPVCGSDPARIRPGVMVVAGNRQAQAVVRVVAVDETGKSISPSCRGPWRRTRSRTTNTKRE